MPDSEKPKQVNNNNLQNTQFSGGLINADTVNAGQIGGNVYNIHLGQQSVTSDNTSSSPQRRERLQQERDSLEKAYVLQSQKVDRLRSAWVIETDSSRKFQYEQQLQTEESTLQELADKLDTMEKHLLQAKEKGKYEQSPKEQETEETKYKKAIFMSYAWGGDSETYVNRLDAVLQSKGITIVRDKRDLGYKGLIKAFMEKIGRGKCVIAVISDKYLKSPNCMFELI